MPSTASKLFSFLSNEEEQAVLVLAKQEIGTTSYANWDSDKSQDDLLVCEYVDRRFAAVVDDSPDERNLDERWNDGWNDGITVAIASEVTWEAFDSTSDEECPPTIGDLCEQAWEDIKSHEEKTKRAIVFGEITRNDKSELKFLEGKHSCLHLICKNWPLGSNPKMIPVLESFRFESLEIQKNGGTFKVLEANKKAVDTTEVHKSKSKTKKQVASPDELYRVPGFIDEVMQLTLDSAPYPNRALAFCGAISLLSLLTGRRVTFQGIASNLYVLALALSASGKDWPRKVNARLLNDANMGGLIGDSFASGEGLEDAMHLSSQMLFQVDEFDAIVQAMSEGKEARFVAITQNLLKFYTSSSSTYYLRRKAGDEAPRTICNPHLSLFATCVPSSLLNSVSAKMLTNGLLARMVVIEAGQRGIGQRAKRIETDESLQKQIAFWKDFGCEGGNLSHLNPEVQTLDATDEALKLLDEFRTYCDLQYDNRYKSQDEGGCAIWGRANELAIKLAAIYTCSDTPMRLVVDVEAVRWATSFAKHHVERMISLSHNGVSESPFDKLCNKLMDRVASSNDGVPQADLLRYSKVDSKQFKLAIMTLFERGQIQATRIKSNNGSEKTVYVLC